MVFFLFILDFMHYSLCLQEYDSSLKYSSSPRLLPLFHETRLKHNRTCTHTASTEFGGMAHIILNFHSPRNS